MQTAGKQKIYIYKFVSAGKAVPKVILNIEGVDSLQTENILSDIMDSKTMGTVVLQGRRTPTCAVGCGDAITPCPIQFSS